ncbi:hypothetical protein CF319_g5260 [Tilletia indica]|nr:hypothetical protein CF319_g5260 [Tilletia indica]
MLSLCPYAGESVSTRHRYFDMCFSLNRPGAPLLESIGPKMSSSGAEVFRYSNLLGRRASSSDRGPENTSLPPSPISLKFLFSLHTLSDFSSSFPSQTEIMVRFNISAVGVMAFVGLLASSSVVTAMPVLKVDAVARQPGSKITPLWGNWGAGGCAWAGPGCGAGRK